MRNAMTLVGAAIAALALTLAQTAAASSTQDGWTIVSTANPTTPTGFLNATSCPHTSTCETVGYTDDAAGTVVMLAERRTGAHWTLEPTVAPAAAGQAVLNGVSCASTVSCIAVGYSVDAAGVITTLAQQRDSAGWHLERSPNPSGSHGAGLFAVSCSAPDTCMAVGTDNRSDGTPVTLAESWNGTRWTVVPTPDPAGATAAQLAAVSCPSAGFCIATGSYRVTSGAQFSLAEVWDGDTWSIESTPNPPGAVQNNLLSVSCPSVGRCFAAGYSSSSDGTTTSSVQVRDHAIWTIAAVRLPAKATYTELSAISCSSSQACTAAGTASSGSLAERWDGNSWRPQVTNSPSRSGFTGVSCASRRRCAAVGFGHPNGNYSIPSAETWNGTAWQVAPVASPVGATTTNLLAVSCPAAFGCVSVGYNTAPDDRTSTLAERSTTAAFSLQDTPSPRTPNAVLDGVSCTSATSCTAVGYFYRADGDRPLAETWDGHAWTIEPTPSPVDAAQGAGLRAVSC